MHTLGQDIREAARLLRKQPRFLVIASLTLALGIGAVTAIFSVVNGVLLKPLPHPNADRLVTIASTAPGLGYDRFPVSPDLFMFYQRESRVFDHMAVSQRRRANLTQSGSPEVVESEVTTHEYFPTLGASFPLGRPYTASEDRPEAPRVAVVSHRLWTRSTDRIQRSSGARFRLTASRRRSSASRPPGWMKPDRQTSGCRPASIRTIRRWARSAGTELAAEGRRQRRQRAGTPRAARRARARAVHQVRHLPCVPEGRCISAGRPPLEGDHCRRPHAAVVDPARYGRHGAARGVRQRRQPVPHPRRGAAARAGGAAGARRPPPRVDPQAARRSVGAVGGWRRARRRSGRDRAAGVAAPRAVVDPAARSRAARPDCPCRRRGGGARLRADLRPRPAIRYTGRNTLAALRHGGRSATDHPGRVIAAATCWSSRRRRWRWCCWWDRDCWRAASRS